MHPARLLFIVALIAAFGLQALGAFKPAYAVESTTGLLVPDYTVPSDPSWHTIEEDAQAFPTVPVTFIINPANGPGNYSSTWTTGVSGLKAAGITPIGYVYTTDCARSIASVESDVNAYKSYAYGITGIFFDEMSNAGGSGCSGSITGPTYYYELTSYAVAQGFTVVWGNAGDPTTSGYVGTVGTINIYEGDSLPSISTLNTDTFNGAYPKTSFSFLAYGVNAASVNQSYITQVSGDVGWLYATNLCPGGGACNPYNGISNYTFELLSYLTVMFIEPLQACTLACALVNQSVLYIAVLVAPLAVIGMVMKIFSDLELQGFIMLMAIVFVMWGLSLFGLVPFYISGVVTAVAVFSQLQNRISRRVQQ